MQMPAIIAHRGASAEAQENTLTAFALAADQGATLWEIDVRRTGDGALVVFHDETTERFEAVGRPLCALTLGQLRRIDLGGERVPTLDEVCALARERGCGLNVELKEVGYEEQVAYTLARHGLYDQAIVSSFYDEALLRLRAAAPALPRGLLMGVQRLDPRIRWREARPLAALRRVEATAWHPHFRLLLIPGLLRSVLQAGYQVNVWTVNDGSLARRLVAAGVSGLITDIPGTLVAALSNRDSFSRSLA